MTPKLILLRILILLTAAPGTDPKGVGEALSQHYDDLRERFGEEADVLIGVPIVEDKFSESPGDDRQIAAVDAVLQLTYPESASVEEIIDRSLGFATQYDAIIDPQGTVAAVGRVKVMVDYDAEIFLVFLGRKRVSVTLEEMRQWWSEEHALMDIELVQPIAPHGYQQFHVEPNLSARLCEIAGFSYVEYHMGDAVFPENMAEFCSALADPEILKVTTRDEKRFLDITTWRGGFMRRVPPQHRVAYKNNGLYK